MTGKLSGQKIKSYIFLILNVFIKLYVRKLSSQKLSNLALPIVVGLCVGAKDWTLEGDAINKLKTSPFNKV